MKATWIIEADMFGDYEEELCTAIRRVGHNANLLTDTAIADMLEKATGQNKEPCILFYGSLQQAEQFAKRQVGVPGTYCTIDKFDCSTYLPYLGKYALNRNYIMLPFGQLAPRKDELFRRFGNNEAIFVRPNSCRKPFSGQLAHAATFEKDLALMAFYDVGPEETVVVSTPQPVVAEFRFVVARKQIVAGCLYYENGEPAGTVCQDNKAETLAQEIGAGDFQPESVWVVDICRTANSEYHLLEIGCFSFADLYACDKVAVATRVSQAALADWEEAIGKLK